MTGDTLFNVLKMGQLETDENERPTFPPKIITTSVVKNPFDDIVPRISETEKKVREELAIKAQQEKLKKPKKWFLLNMLLSKG